MPLDCVSPCWLLPQIELSFLIWCAGPLKRCLADSSSCRFNMEAVNHSNTPAAPADGLKQTCLLLPSQHLKRFLCKYVGCKQTSLVVDRSEASCTSAACREEKLVYTERPRANKTSHNKTMMVLSKAVSSCVMLVNKLISPRSKLKK